MVLCLPHRTRRLSRPAAEFSRGGLPSLPDTAALHLTRRDYPAAAWPKENQHVVKNIAIGRFQPTTGGRQSTQCPQVHWPQERGRQAALVSKFIEAESKHGRSGKPIARPRRRPQGISPPASRSGGNFQTGGDGVHCGGRNAGAYLVGKEAQNIRMGSRGTAAHGRFGLAPGGIAAILSDDATPAAPMVASAPGIGSWAGGKDSGRSPNID